METSSGEMVYVLVHDPAYPRDLSSTIFILFKKKIKLPILGQCTLNIIGNYINYI